MLRNTVMAPRTKQWVTDKRVGYKSIELEKTSRKIVRDRKRFLRVKGLLGLVYGYSLFLGGDPKCI